MLGNNFIDELSDNEEEKEILSFGIERIKVFLIGISAVLVTGLIFNQLLETIIFMVCILPLRQNAGGYHLSNKWACAAVSYVTLFLSVYIIKHAYLNPTVMLLIVAPCIITIILLAPIGNKNRELDDMEKTVFGRRAKILSITEGLILLFSIKMGYDKMCMPIVLSELIVSLLLTIGKIIENSECKCVE